MTQYNETITEAYVKMVSDRAIADKVIVEENITETDKPKVYQYNEDLAEAYVQMKSKQVEKIEESTICEKCGRPNEISAAE